jgi:hypothetical protein
VIGSRLAEPPRRIAPWRADPSQEKCHVPYVNVGLATEFVDIIVS